MNKILSDYKNIYRLIAAFTVVFIGGLVIITASYDSGQKVEHNIEMLVDDHLPKLDTIYSLQTSIKTLELVLYRYYETTDSESYQTEWADNQQRIAQLLRNVDDSVIKTVQDYLVNLNTIADDFDSEMRNSDTDWNVLRLQLEKAHQVSSGFDLVIDDISIGLRQSFTNYNRDTQVIISKMLLSQIMFSGFVLLLLLIVAIVIRRQLNQHYLHRELALYPERNPHPILRMSNTGQALYLNPAALKLAESLGVNDKPSRLLPKNYKQQSRDVRSKTQRSDYRDYSLGHRQFSAFIHHIEGDDSAYAYLMDVTDRAKAEQKLKFQSSHDVLTGLPNRRQLEVMLEAKTGGTLSPFSLIFIKAGRIDLINASLGHEITDKVLVAMSERLSAFIEQETDRELSLFSFESTSWVIIYHHNGIPSLAKQLGDDVVNLFAGQVSISGSHFNMQCTAGVTLYPQGGSSKQELLRNADAALRQGAEEGLAVRLYSQDLTEQANRWLVLEQGLKQALDKNEFTINIQPKVDAETGAFKGGEVLLRWLNQGNWISPAEFIPVAEESDLIIRIGEWVLKTACEQWVAWQAEGLNPKRIAVNISAQHFVQAGFVDLVTNTLSATGMPAAELELEITEEVATEDPEKLIAIMTKLKSLGVRLSIDDFGTGYSSLSYLRRFPIDTLKIDQSFVFKMEDSENDAAIVRMIMSLAQELNLEVVAEGVEVKTQQQTLAALGCDLIQGYYFYKPLLLAEYRDLLAESE